MALFGVNRTAAETEFLSRSARAREVRGIRLLLILERKRDEREVIPPFRGIKEEESMIGVRSGAACYLGKLVLR